MKNFCHRTRREMLWESGAGFMTAALSSMLGDDFFARAASTPHANPLAPKQPHFDPKAKSVIFLYMYGGPSHIDTFEYKPAMKGMDNKTVQVKTFGRGGHKNEGRIVEPRWKFKQYGQCGKWVSDLFPNLAHYVDDIAFLHSMTADSPIHGSAMLQMNTGKILSGSPCLGSWVNYGLGSENENLPGFVVMLDPRGGPISGAKNWSSGYMPAHYEGTMFRSGGTPILDLKRPERFGEAAQRDLLDTLRAYNSEHAVQRGHNPALESRISSYELAFKMQSAAPEAVDFNQESEKTKEMYGLTSKRTKAFGRQCLLARRLVERGVRFVQIYSGGNHNDANWDAQHLVENHDCMWEKPITVAGLQDLKQRGSRPDAGRQGANSAVSRPPSINRHRPRPQRLRLHNVAGRRRHQERHQRRATDELGRRRRALPSAHSCDRFASTGLDPDRLSYFYGGLDQKLVGAWGGADSGDHCVSVVISCKHRTLPAVDFRCR